tara:strand:+ start:83 stop:469 length:387 start_codon:yes stop_codon:yes gene_type:complete
MSSPFQRKFSGKSPLTETTRVGAYEGAFDSPRYLSNAADFQKLQDNIVSTGLAAKKRNNQIDEWESEAEILYPTPKEGVPAVSGVPFGASGTETTPDPVVGLTDEQKKRKEHYRKYGPMNDKKKSACS